MKRNFKITVALIIFFLMFTSSSILAYGDTSKVSDAGVTITKQYIQNHKNTAKASKVNNYNVQSKGQISNDSKINNYMAKHHDVIAGSSISTISLLILGINSLLKKKF